MHEEILSLRACKFIMFLLGYFVAGVRGNLHCYYCYHYCSCFHLDSPKATSLNQGGLGRVNQEKRNLVASVGKKATRQKMRFYVTAKLKYIMLYVLVVVTNQWPTESGNRGSNEWKSWHASLYNNWVVIKRMWMSHTRLFDLPFFWHSNAVE